jgi:hypothetical protein
VPASEKLSQTDKKYVRPDSARPVNRWSIFG